MKALAARLKYLAAEIPGRLARILLSRTFGLQRYHILTPQNKPYVRDVAAYLNGKGLGTVVEVGCGLCDVLSRLKASRRIGYDSDRGVLSAAGALNRLKLADVELRRLDFFADDVPEVQADAWILVALLDAFAEDEIRPKLREIFRRLKPGGLIVVDAVSGPQYRHHHDFGRIFEGLPCDIRAISRHENPGRGASRTVFCLAKSA